VTWQSQFSRILTGSVNPKNGNRSTRAHALTAAFGATEGHTRAMPPALLPADAVRIAQRARKLLRAGRISHRDYCILDNLLWSCRAKGAGHAIVSYNALAKLAHVAKATVAAAVKALEAVGLISRIRRRALFPWAGGGLQARQLANQYILLAPAAHEFSDQPVNKSESILSLIPAVSNYAIEVAQASLAARRRVIEGRLLMNEG
jgi:DNA-binding transcriptional regulator YhcF (GntR family)